MQLGPIELMGELTNGFSVQIYIERTPHPEYRFRRQFCLFAAWLCRGCDAGFCLLGRDFRVRLPRRR